MTCFILRILKFEMFEKFWPAVSASAAQVFTLVWIVQSVSKIKKTFFLQNFQSIGPIIELKDFEILAEFVRS